jgi:GxxExxY protein
MTLLHNETTRKILKAFFDVYNELGFGFLEKVYENSLHLELAYRGCHVETQKRIKVYYKMNEVGVYCPDWVVDNTLVIEVKAPEYLLPIHEAQLLNYLKSTDV